MQKMSDILPGVKKKFGYATPEQATWTCETCGEVQPHYLVAVERYMKAMCACQRKEQERIHKEDEERRHQAFLREQRRHTYGWLGSRWSDEALEEKTFGNFKLFRQVAAYETTLAFLDIRKGTLILYGSYGTGKTHLLAALCQEMNKRSVDCRFTTAPKLFAAIQYRIGMDEDYTSLIQKAIETPLLVIDDVDKAKYSEFREEIYFEIIDSRVNAGRPLAISTNKLDKLADYVGGACTSRLAIGQIAIEMNGTDYRTEL